IMGLCVPRSKIPAPPPTRQGRAIAAERVQPLAELTGTIVVGAPRGPGGPARSRVFVRLSTPDPILMDRAADVGLQRAFRLAPAPPQRPRPEGAIDRRQGESESGCEA